MCFKAKTKTACVLCACFYSLTLSRYLDKIVLSSANLLSRIGIPRATKPPQFARLFLFQTGNLVLWALHLDIEVFPFHCVRQRNVSPRLSVL